jgi:hypothetical protein
MDHFVWAVLCLAAAALSVIASMIKVFPMIMG